MVDRFAFPDASWKINPFGNWVRVSDFESVEKRAFEAETNLEACRTVAATLRVQNEALLSELAALQTKLKKAETDASRWNALLRCARIRMQGSAGFDPKTGERQQYSNATGEFEKRSDGWVHFGAEFWSIYPGHEDADKETRWGTIALIALADDVLLKEAHARGEGGDNADG